MSDSSTEWKAAQRDWLLSRLRALITKWYVESQMASTVYMPDVDLDNVAKSRTGGCARELEALLAEIK